MKKRIILSVTGLLIVLLTVRICRADNFNNTKVIHNSNNIEKQTMNYVPDKETAKKIAEAIWLPIYGERIYNQKPYVVSLANNIWIVKGTIPEGRRGGVAYIKIRKTDCKILKVIHGK